MLKIQDGRRKPFWIYANKHIKEKKCVTWSLCDHVINAVIMWRWTRNPREFPTLYSVADTNELGDLLVPGGLLVNTWQMTT